MYFHQPMRTLVLFLLVAVSYVGLAQSVTATLESKLPLDTYKFIGVDRFSHFYYIKDNIFYKKERQQTYQYTDFLLGTLSSVDILNPLKIVLFYEDTNTAVILDNTLSEITRINFNQIEAFRNVQYASTAIDRNLWLYNLDLQQLEVYNYNREEIEVTSLPVSQEVNFQKSNYNFCWLVTNEVVKQFNIYGSLIEEYPMPYIKAIAEKNDNLVVASNNTLFYLGKNSTVFQEVEMPEIDVKDLYLDIQNLYIYDGEYLHHYQLQLPKN